MADNVELNAGSGGVQLATDDVAGIHYQWVKLAYGANDSVTKVDGSNPLPVTVTACALPTGAATEAKQDAGNASLASVDTAIGTTTDAAVTGDNDGTVSAKLRGINKILADVWDNINHRVSVSVANATIAVTQSGAWSVSLSASLPAGTNNIGDVDVLSLPALPAGNNNIGDVDVATVPSDPFGANADVASATGSISAKLRFIASTGIPITGTVTVGSHAVTNAGTFSVQESTTCSTFHLASAGSTNATSVKASAGTLYGWYIYNSNAAARKVAFHNTAGTPTAGSGVVFSLVIPAGSAANVFFNKGISFATGIAITTVTGLADSDNTAVAANDLIINLWYA